MTHPKTLACLPGVKVPVKQWQSQTHVVLMLNFGWCGTHRLEIVLVHAVQRIQSKNKSAWDQQRMNILFLSNLNTKQVEASRLFFEESERRVRLKKSSFEQHVSETHHSLEGRSLVGHDSSNNLETSPPGLEPVMRKLMLCFLLNPQWMHAFDRFGPNSLTNQNKFLLKQNNIYEVKVKILPSSEVVRQFLH